MITVQPLVIGRFIEEEVSLDSTHVLEKNALTAGIIVSDYSESSDPQTNKIKQLEPCLLTSINLQDI